MVMPGDNVTITVKLIVPVAMDKGFVITSYSIHYTKLYEGSTTTPCMPWCRRTGRVTGS